MTDTDRNDELIVKAGGLRTEIAPERDLWPGITEGIARPKRSRFVPMFAQAAAVVLLVGASSLVTYLAMDRDSDPYMVVAPELNMTPVSFAQRDALGPSYQQARMDMAAQLENELEKLDSETRDKIEKNLALIRKSIDEINTALIDEPNNVLLQEFLLDAYQDELQFMHKVGGLTKHVMSRTDI
ncbi:MAG: hypothetical protein GTO71_00480 [Woeseiaceae bacterium]|nr:hypothetical protein [Woeseiaceae bacterium]NIP19598.1 hypothetical protein [Woeseiaceae bacterium]